MPEILDEPNEPIRPRISIDGTIREAAQAIEMAMRAHDIAFRRDGTPVRIVETDEGRMRVDEMNAADICQHAMWYLDIVQTKKVDDEPVPVRVNKLSRELGAAIVSSTRDTSTLKTVKQVRRTPIYSPDFTLNTRHGYDESTQTFIDLQGARIPDVTGEDVQTAVSLIDDLLRDFPFADDASRANAVASMLTHFIREAVDLVPMTLLSAPMPGSGKTFFVEVVSLICHDVDPALVHVTDGAELEKRVTATLKMAPTHAYFDNVKPGAMFESISAVAASLLTAGTWTGRNLGHSQMVTLKNTTQWMMTSNNPDFSDEMTRRILPVRLEPDVEKPGDRELRDLKEHVREHRTKIIWACLEVIEHWRRQGMPLGDVKWGSYQRWAEVAGGIVEAAGYEGFATNRDTLVAPEANVLHEFVEYWKTLPPGESSAKLLADRFDADADMTHLIDDITDGQKPGPWRSRKLSEWLRRQEGRVCAGKRIVGGYDNHANKAVFSLEPVT